MVQGHKSLQNRYNLKQTYLNILDYFWSRNIFDYKLYDKKVIFGLK